MAVLVKKVEKKAPASIKCWKKGYDCLKKEIVMGFSVFFYAP